MTQCSDLAARRDDRKSAAVARARVNVPSGERAITAYSALREIFRMGDASQGMAGGDVFGSSGNPDHTPIFFLDGEAHRRRRNAIARYFTPKAINGRLAAVMQQTSEALMTQLQHDGSAALDEIAFQMAVDVTAEVIGLTSSDSRAQARRLRKILDSDLISNEGRRNRWLKLPVFIARLQIFYLLDVRPAVRARRRSPGEDVISQMIKENYPARSMLLECLIYGVAGMVTTRELITMAAWHMLENEALRRRFVDGTEDDQFAIIEEILRLERVAGMLYRILPAKDGGGRERVCLDIRAANLDEAVTGPCPYTLDPDRAARMKMTTSYMSFGDGPHRCPGAQLALHEARIFLDLLMRLPGVRLSKEPQIGWQESIMGYELRGAVVTCDRNPPP